MTSPRGDGTAAAVPPAGLPDDHLPAAVPEWARESIARTARDYPGNLPGQLSHVAEVEAARRHMAQHPPLQPPLPDDPRGFLHLLAIQAWQAIASGRPAPAIAPCELCLVISDAFETPGGNLSDQVYDTWCRLAEEHGLTITDEDGDFLEPLEAAVSGLIAAAIWFGITTGYYTLAGQYSIPRKFLA